MKRHGPNAWVQHTMSRISHAARGSTALCSERMHLLPGTSSTRCLSFKGMRRTCDTAVGGINQLPHHQCQWQSCITTWCSTQGSKCICIVQLPALTVQQCKYSHSHGLPQAMLASVAPAALSSPAPSIRQCVRWHQFLTSLNGWCISAPQP